MPINTRVNVLETLLTGFATLTGVITAADSVLIAFGKIQGQVTPMLVYTTTIAYTNSSSSSAVNIAQLAISVVAGKSYLIQSKIRYKSAASNRGIQLSFTSGNAIGTLTAVANIISGPDGTSAGVVGSITSLGDYVNGGAVPLADTDTVALLDGIFVCTTSGTIQSSFLNSSGTNLITVQPSSFLIVRESV